MFHYTYLLQHRESDMMYIGVRSCECMPQQDNYWGSSNHTPENVSEVCDKFILGVFDTREEAMLDEIARHDRNDVARNPLFWNQCKSTTTGFDRYGTRFKLSEEAVENLRVAMKKRSENGYIAKHTPESKAKISKANKGRKRSKEFIEYARKRATGIKFSEERKRKMSESQKGKPRLKNTECPHCGKIGDAANMTRWHLGNCKKLEK